MCTSEPSRRAAVDFPREQRSLSAQLTELKSSIDVDLAKAEEQLATSNSDGQQRMERVNRALLREKGEVQKAIQNVNNATEVKWASVKKEAKYTLDDTRRTCYKLEKNL